MNRRNKYNAVKVRHQDMTFDSQREFARYNELLLLQRAGEISDLVVHPVYVLRAFDCEICRYIADFEYFEIMKGERRWVVEDVKSPATEALPTFRLKLKLFRANFPSVDFRVIGLNKKYPTHVRRKPIAR